MEITFSKQAKMKGAAYQKIMPQTGVLATL